VNPGNITFTRYCGGFFHTIICLVLLLFFTGYFTDLDRELFVTLIVLIAVAALLMIIRYKQLLLYSLALLVPVSFPFEVAGTSVVNVPSELICAIFTGFFLVKIITGNKPNPAFLKHPVTMLICCDLAWLFISSLFSQMPEASFKRLIIRTCYYSTFYYFYLELFHAGNTNIKRVLTLHVIGFLIPIVYATFNHAKLGFTTVGSQRISAPFYYDHTIYGACLVFFIPFLMHQALNAQSYRCRKWFIILSVIFLVATVLSYSRAAWLSLLIAAGINLIIKYKIKTKYILIALSVGVLGAFINWEKIIVGLKENKEISHSNNITMHLKSISNVNTDASNKERINRWKCALRMFEEKPLAGFGPGTYQFFYGQYQQRQDLTRISTFIGNRGHAHSEYLNYLSETGLPGLLIFVSLLIAVCVTGIRLINRSNDSFTRNTALFTLTGLITYIVHAFFNGFLEFDKMAMPVFTSFAIITHLDLKMRSERSQQPSS